LYDQAHADGIPAGCGPQCLIANKTGETSEVHHDVAVVTSGTGKYVVAIMSSGASWQAVAEVEHAINAAMKP
jgi:beta-lactamase class A